MAHTTQNAEYSIDTHAFDMVGGTSPSYAGVTQNGGGKKRKQMRTKKKRGASKRKNRKVSTLRKKRGSSKRKNRGSLKRREHSKREVVKSIMKGLGEKRKTRKKSIKGGWGWWDRMKWNIQNTISDQRAHSAGRGTIEVGAANLAQGKQYRRREWEREQDALIDSRRKQWERIYRLNRAETGRRRRLTNKEKIALETSSEFGT